MKDGKLDINTIIGLLLIGGILIYFNYTSEPEVVSNETTTEQADSTKVSKSKEDEKPSLIAKMDTLVNDSLNIDYGTFGRANDPNAKEEFFTLENDVLEVVFSSKGGQVVKARLKEYQTYDSLPLLLIDGGNNNTSLSLQADGKTYKSQDLSFNGAMKNDSTLIMSLSTIKGQKLEYQYTLSNSYDLDWEVTTNNFEDYLDKAPVLTWEMSTMRHEKNLKNEKTKTALNYRLLEEGDVDEMSITADDEETEKDVDWVAYKQQFFFNHCIP